MRQKFSLSLPYDTVFGLYLFMIRGISLKIIENSLETEAERFFKYSENEEDETILHVNEPFNWTEIFVKAIFQVRKSSKL